MKGLSIVLTIVLLVMAEQLAAWLKRAHALPAQQKQAQPELSAVKVRPNLPPGTTLTL